MIVEVIAIIKRLFVNSLDVLGLSLATFRINNISNPKLLKKINCVEKVIINEYLPNVSTLVVLAIMVVITNEDPKRIEFVKN